MAQVADGATNIVDDFRRPAQREMDEIVIACASAWNAYRCSGAILNVADVAVGQIKRVRNEIEAARLAWVT